MMDLKGTIILIENPEACSWKSFHEPHYNYLLHTTCFHDFLFTHIFFHEQLVLLSHTHSPCLPKKN
jgi:hypothetical protein